MPAFNPVDLKDHQATPVVHTFKPLTKELGGLFVWSESDGVPLNSNRLTALRKESEKQIKPSVRIQVPKVQTETVNGISRPVVVYTDYVNIEFSFSKASSLEDRKELRALARNILTDTTAAFSAFFDDLENFH